MKNLDLSKKVVAAAVCGLFAGVASTSVAKAAPGEKNANYKADDAAKDDHVCKGKNACKGKGGCKTDANACAGKNDCKGKGGCASATAKHDCKGKNACKTLGGCKSGDAGCRCQELLQGQGWLRRSGQAVIDRSTITRYVSLPREAKDGRRVQFVMDAPAAST